VTAGGAEDECAGFAGERQNSRRMSEQGLSGVDKGDSRWRGDVTTKEHRLVFCGQRLH